VLTSWKSTAKAIGWAVVFMVVAFTVALLGAWFAAAALVGGFEPAEDWLSVVGPAQIILQGITLTLAGLLATYLIGIRALGLDFASLRWRSPDWESRGVEWGLLLGVGAAALTLLSAVLVGNARWVGDEGTALQFVTQGLKTLVVLAPAALSEELLFRGVPLVVLAMAVGRGPAVAVTAIAFGIAHSLNPDVTAQAVANVTLAGLFLGAAFYCPGGLWTAFAAHLGWNVTLAVSGAAVSGVPFDIPVVDYQAGGPGWLTGGGFGPEGGLLATVALAAGTVAAARWARKGTP
jgi:membrane protease YdiL (CAAX protease family)